MSEYGTFDRTPMLSHHHELAHGIVLEGLETMVKSIDLFYDSLVALQENIARHEARWGPIEGAPPDQPMH